MLFRFSLLPSTQSALLILLTRSSSNILLRANERTASDRANYDRRGRAGGQVVRRVRKRRFLPSPSLSLHLCTPRLIAPQMSCRPGVQFNRLKHWILGKFRDNFSSGALKVETCLSQNSKLDLGQVLGRIKCLLNWHPRSLARAICFLACSPLAQKFHPSFLLQLFSSEEAG